MCLFPTLGENKKYKANKKNRGNIPPVPDERVLYVAYGCGNCIECRKQKARGWQLRLLEDVKHHTNGKFVTLTFSNESIAKLIKYEKRFKDKETGRTFKLSLSELTGYNLDNEIAKVAVRLFLERWRRKYGKSLRHWLVTELGHNGTENIHLHGIVWTDINLNTLEEIWEYGHVWKGKEHIQTGKMVNYVSARTVNYIIKYITKKDEKHTTYKSIILTSAGIGKDYLKTHNSRNNKYKGIQTRETYQTDTGHKISMPIYWRNKIYTDEEREQLWLQKLDKQERWVMGERIDISKGYEEYDKSVKYYRKLNKELGFGGDEKNEQWLEKALYETNRRKIMLATRLKNLK